MNFRCDKSILLAGHSERS